jgi:uncharacterized protein
MLDLLDAILLTIKAANNKISGRTAIQKLIYFESVFDLVEVKYRPYYYGPYSSDLMSTIETMVSLNFIKENIDVMPTEKISGSIEWKKYEYVLTEDGKELSNQLVNENGQEYEKIRNIVKICNEKAHLDVNTLACASKIYFILTSKKMPMTGEEIADTASSFGWELSRPQIDGAKELLKALQLCEVA